MSRDVMEATQCQHVWRHLDTVRFTSFSGGYNTTFTRIDRFYCEKCLEQNETKMHDACRDTPDWYRTGDK